MKILPDVLPECVERAIMPQIDEGQYFNLWQWLRDSKIRQDFAELPWWALRPRQRAEQAVLDRSSTLDISTKRLLLAKRILVANDLSILDGRHRWELHKMRAAGELLYVQPGGDLTPVYIIDLPFREAVEKLCSFSEVYTFGAGPQPERN